MARPTGVERSLGPFLASSKTQRKLAVEYAVKEAGYIPTRMPFMSIAGPGENILVTSEYPLARGVTLIVAHYDGNDFHDNAGGVWTALEIIRLASADGDSKLSFAVLFTDHEEDLQQGAAAFVRKLGMVRELGSPTNSISRVLCIDGVGAGSEHMLRQHDLPLCVGSRYFRMDADVFLEHGYETYTFSTGVDCLRQLSTGEIPRFPVSEASFSRWKEWAPRFLLNWVRSDLSISEEASTIALHRLAEGLAHNASLMGGS